MEEGNGEEIETCEEWEEVVKKVAGGKVGSQKRRGGACARVHSVRGRM